MSAPKKFIIAAVLFTFYFLLFTVPVYAQTTPIATGTATYSDSYMPSVSPQYTDALVNSLTHTYSCVLVGQSILGYPCQTFDITRNLPKYEPNYGVLGSAIGYIGALYLNPPVRTYEYFVFMRQDLGFVKEAYAQTIGGSGNQVLSPIISLWAVSRNISYIIMAIVFVVIGLMVMFRQRVNPQTVITVQAALPGLVIGLILITFSYFFAALIIDFAFIGTNLVGYYFQTAQTSGNPQASLIRDTGNQNALTIFSQFISLFPRGEIVDAIDLVLSNIQGTANTAIHLLAGVVAFQFGAQVGQIAGPYSSFVSPILGLIAGIGAATIFTSQIIGTFFWVIALAALIYSMLRLLLRLIQCYLSIIFLTITAPFHFLAASLPGRQSIATDWVRNMLCNVLSFPAVMAIFYFAAFVLQQTVGPLSISGAPNITDSAALPLLGGLNLKFVQILLAFGALTAAPAIPDIICKAIGKPGPGGQMIEQAINTGMGRGQSYINQGTGGIKEASGSVRGLFDQTEVMRTKGEPTYRTTLGGLSKVQELKKNPPWPWKKNV